MTYSAFKHKVVWITGASGGIGEALAKQFAMCGSRLILSARREDELDRVGALCRGAQSVSVCPLDLSCPQSLPEIVRTTLAREGIVDVMVHNAGVSQRAFGYDTLYDTDELIMRTNYLGPIALTKALLPSMRARRQGHFIVVTSVLGKFGLPGRSAYCASKHALHGFFDTLRAELWPDNIHVTLVLPGWVRTNISMSALTGTGSPQRKMDAGTAAGFSPEVCAERIVAGAASGKAEINVVKPKEYAALQLNRVAPSVLRRLIRGRQI